MTAPNSSEGAEQSTTSNLTAAEIALSDPLKPETRKARVFLLGVSLVGITIVYTGLVPQEITTLGVTFGEANRRYLLFILALVIFYFLVAFVVYGGSDFLASRTAFLRVRWSDLRADAERWEEEQRHTLEEPKRAMEEQLKQTVEQMGAHYDRRKRRIEERIAAGLSKEEATTKVDEEVNAQARTASVRTAQGALLPPGPEAKDIQKIFEPLYRRAEEADQSGDETFKSAVDAMYEAAVESQIKIGQTTAEILAMSRPARLQEAERTFRRYAAISPKMWYIRSLFEFLLPILVGLYAIYALLAVYDGVASIFPHLV